MTAQTSDPVEILSRGIAAAVPQTAAKPDVNRILKHNEHQIRDLPGLDEVVRQRRAMRQRVESVIASGITSLDCSSRAVRMVRSGRVSLRA